MGRSLIESNKDHFLSQARSEPMRQEHQVGSLNCCISELQQKAYAQILELQDAQHGYIESRREQVRLQEALSMKEKLLRDTQIRNTHEMGEIKRAQEQRIDKVSVQNLRENHETIQQLTSNLQQMQEQMNSMNDSGELQEVENHSGRLSYVSSQPEVIPSSRSMLSRDKRLPLDTWNSSGLQENVFGNQFSTFGSPGNHSQGIHNGVAHKTPRETESVPRAIGTGTSFARDDEQKKGTIPMPLFARRPCTMNSSIPVEIQQNPVVGQQRQQISELQCDKFLTPHPFLCWKIRFKNQVTTCSDFPSDAVVWINEVVMVDSLDEVKSSRSVAGNNFPNFEMLDEKIASALNNIIQNSHFKKKVSLEEQKAQKEGRFLRGRQIAFMIYDYFRVSGAHDTVLDYADFFSVTLHDDNAASIKLSHLLGGRAGLITVKGCAYLRCFGWTELPVERKRAMFEGNPVQFPA